MKLYIAGTASHREIVENRNIPYLLESYYYIKPWQMDYIKNHCQSFILDSGAFTFMGGFSFTQGNTNIQWEKYCDEYAEFVKANNIQYFIELDIDSVVGYDKVKELRRELEKKVGRQCIPVWHSTRGVEEWKSMCDEYSYVAIGGIVGGEWKAQAEKFIPWFIKEAHKRNAMVHGLGFTKTKKLKEYHFDSVDSTRWSAGARFGDLHYYIDGEIRNAGRRNGYRCHGEKALRHNLDEWLKMQKYADDCL